MCGEEFDPIDDQVIECATCDSEGSTKCCIPAGRGTECLDCEAGDIEP